MGLEGSLLDQIDRLTPSRSAIWFSILITSSSGQIPSFVEGCQQVDVGIRAALRLAVRAEHRQPCDTGSPQLRLVRTQGNDYGFRGHGHILPQYSNQAQGVS